jgi:hypothetical protein
MSGHTPLEYGVVSGYTVAMTTLQRFPADLSEMFDRCIPIPFSGCWAWNGTVAYDGYGRLPSGRRGVTFPAHRVAYEYAKGPIPDGMQIDHLCRVKCCINPDHLEAVTPSINVLRGLVPTTASKHMKSLQDRLKAELRSDPAPHCKRGHPFDDENTYVDKNGFWHCRECKRTAFRKWQQAGGRNK